MDFFVLQLSAQKESSISDIISDPKLDYFQMQSIIECGTKLENAEEWELKRYQRWYWFWKNRIDANQFLINPIEIISIKKI